MSVGASLWPPRPLASPIPIPVLSLTCDSLPRVAGESGVASAASAAEVGERTSLALALGVPAAAAGVVTLVGDSAGGVTTSASGVVLGDSDMPTGVRGAIGVRVSAGRSSVARADAGCRAGRGWRLESEQMSD